jgi:peptidoglycan/xylan/chitin deacetylase (PgdA/CDA1 family)
VELDLSVSPLRYACKKIARRIVAEASAVLGGLTSEPTIRVLSYHRFGESSRDPVMVTPARFDAQMRWLVSHVDVLTPARFAAIQRGTEVLYRDAVLVTIDDGHASVATCALPVLEHYAVAAVLFVCPELVESAGGEFVSWTELETCLQLGHTVASHGSTHRSLGRVPLTEATAEIAAAKETLARKLGVAGPYFAFPFGTRADFSPPLLSVLKAHGYEFCFTSIHGGCTPTHTLSWFPRVKVESGEDMRMFSHIATGKMDAWRHVDNLAWALQQRNRL